MLKSLTLTFIVIITIVITCAVVYYIRMDELPFAICINFLLMGCVLSFTETLKSPLRSPYFKDKLWEQRGKVYESVGVNLYRKFLVAIGWEKLNKIAKPVKKTTDALVHLHYKTKQDELGHLIIFVIVFGFGVYVALEYGVAKSLWLFTTNVLLNLYPIFLQRFNRPRIARAITLSKHKDNDIRLPVT